MEPQPPVPTDLSAPPPTDPPEQPMDVRVAVMLDNLQKRIYALEQKFEGAVKDALRLVGTHTHFPADPPAPADAAPAPIITTTSRPPLTKRVEVRDAKGWWVEEVPADG